MSSWSAALLKCPHCWHKKLMPLLIFTWLCIASCLQHWRNKTAFRNPWHNRKQSKRHNVASRWWLTTAYQKDCLLQKESCAVGLALDFITAVQVPFHTYPSVTTQTINSWSCTGLKRKIFALFFQPNTKWKVSSLKGLLRKYGSQNKRGKKAPLDFLCILIKCSNTLESHTFKHRSLKHNSQNIHCILKVLL